MSEPADSQPVGGDATLRVGEWTVETGSGEIQNAATTLRLEPKYVDVLVHLARRHGQVVTKEELLASVWTDSFVGDKALVRCIAGLRKAFGDDPRRPRYIETLHRRGYRLIAPVTLDGEPRGGTHRPNGPAPAAAVAALVEGADAPPAGEQRPPWRGRPLARLGLALLVATVGAVALWLSARGRVGPSMPASETAADSHFAVVAVFDNLSGRERLDALSTVFRVGLEQSRRIGVLPETQVRAALARMERDPEEPIDRAVGIDLSRREGVQFLVRGEVVAVGDVVTLSAEVIDPATDETVFTAESRAVGENEVLPALDRLVSEIRQALGESVDGPPGSPTPLEKVTTSNLGALEAYSLGRRAWGRGQVREAMAYYTSALEIDPGFAMARVSRALIFLSGEMPQGREELLRALEDRDRLPLYENIYARAWLATTDLDYPEMMRLWTLLTTLFPENAAGHFNLGMLRGLYGGDAEFAAATMRRAADRLGPGFRLRPALVELRLGRVDEALALVSPPAVPPIRGQAGYATLIQMAAERPGEAATLLERAELWHPEDRAWARFFFHLDRGRLRRALESLETLETPSAAGLSHLQLLSVRAQVLHRAGEPGEAGIAEAARQVVDHAEPIARLGNSPVPVAVALGALAARAGELAVAEELLATARALTGARPVPSHLALTEVLAGEVAAAAGLHAQALEHFRASLETVEVYAAYDGLARSHRALGDTDRAIELLETLIGRRAQALGECFELGYYCAGLEANILRWNEALYRLATLYEAVGRDRDAERLYRRFVERWHDGDEGIATLRDARQRLRALAAPS